MPRLKRFRILLLVATVAAPAYLAFRSPIRLSSVVTRLQEADVPAEFSQDTDFRAVPYSSVPQ